MIAALDLCFADHEQHIKTAGQDLHDPDRDLSHLSERRGEIFCEAMMGYSWHERVPVRPMTKRDLLNSDDMMMTA